MSPYEKLGEIYSPQDYNSDVVSDAEPEAIQIGERYAGIPKTFLRAVTKADPEMGAMMKKNFMDVLAPQRADLGKTRGQGMRAHTRVNTGEALTNQITRQLYQSDIDSYMRSGKDPEWLGRVYHIPHPTEPGKFRAQQLDATDMENFLADYTRSLEQGVAPLNADLSRSSRLEPIAWLRDTPTGGLDTYVTNPQRTLSPLSVGEGSYDIDGYTLAGYPRYIPPGKLAVRSELGELNIRHPNKVDPADLTKNLDLLSTTNNPAGRDKDLVRGLYRPILSEGGPLPRSRLNKIARENAEVAREDQDMSFDAITGRGRAEAKNRPNLSYYLSQFDGVSVTDVMANIAEYSRAYPEVVEYINSNGAMPSRAELLQMAKKKFNYDASYKKGMGELYGTLE